MEVYLYYYRAEGISVDYRVEFRSDAATFADMKKKKMETDGKRKWRDAVGLWEAAKVPSEQHHEIKKWRQTHEGGDRY